MNHNFEPNLNFDNKFDSENLFGFLNEGEDIHFDNVMKDIQDFSKGLILKKDPNDFTVDHLEKKPFKKDNIKGKDLEL